MLSSAEHQTKASLSTHSEKCKLVYQKNMYQLDETLFDEFDSFGIPYKNSQKLFDNMTILILNQEFKDTETKTSVGKHTPISISTSSNLIHEPFFLGDPNPRELVSSSIDALDNLSTRGELK